MKRFLSLSLVSCLWILVSPNLTALVDTNSNGLSDLWERASNDNKLFDETYDLQADPDGDGWTNEQEAAAGTDPREANPPAGFLRPVIEHIPAVWGDDDNDGVPNMVSPDTIDISWPETPGKQYTLTYSFDLTAGSWIAVGEPFIGNGSINTSHVLLTEPDKRFWRVAIDDTDSDGDGLSDAEESTLGTNPASADSDSF